MRNTIAFLLVLLATPAAAEPRCASVDRPERPQFTHPLPGKIVRGFGAQPEGAGHKFNPDIAYAATAGEAVRAAADGQISHIHVDRMQPEGAGQRLTLRHAQGYATAYAPMGEIAVRPGDCVSAGDIIGRVGAADAGARLHFVVMIHSRMVDPERIRGGLPAR